MKRAGTYLMGIIAIVALLTFQNCKDDPAPSDKEVAEELLKSKTWKVSSVDVPASTATGSDDWKDFTVSFNAQMATLGHPTGATAVWPGGGYTVSEDGKSITRAADDVVMTISGLSESGFTARFTVPAGTEIGGRIAALEGDYTFNME